MINFLGICNGNSLKIFRFLGIIINIIFIIVPIILVILGTIDLVKYLINQDKSNLETIFKRIIAGIIIFFIFPITRFLISLTGANLNTVCMECFIDYKSKICVEIGKKNVIDDCGYELNSNICCSEKYNSNGFIYKYNESSGTCDRN